MLKNNIYCKSALTREQLEARKSLKKSGIELQLLGDFEDNPLSTKEYIEILAEIIYDIKAVHVPLKKGEEIVEIQMLDNEKARSLFDRVCELSQAISDINGETILIVIHNRWDVSDFNLAKNSTESIVNYLRDILIKYPSIRIGIENVVAFMNYTCMFTNGVMPNYVEVIKYLRKELNTDRVGTVLDTCHAIASLRILKLIEDYEDISFSISLEDYFKANKDICFLVHLANVKGLGFNINTHGIGFEEDKELLIELVNMYNKYLSGVDITIEVGESDFIKCSTYRANYDMLVDIIN